MAEEDEPAPSVALSAVVVNYNARRHLVDCVRSLRSEGVSDVIVADNGSTDESRAALAAADPHARFIDLGRNLGYGGAANRGLGAVRGRAVLVCNPDVTVRSGAVGALASVLAQDGAVAVAGPKILSPEGELYPSARTFPSLADSVGHAFLGMLWPANPFSRSYKMLDWDHATGRRVDWVSGACFLARTEALESVGGFDESYFMYMEDVDLCWRLRRSGWEIGYEPSAVVVHVQGVSTVLHPYRMILAHHRSMLRFARRSATGWRLALVPLMAVGTAIRAVLACAKRVVGTAGSRTRIAAPERPGEAPRPE